MADAVMYMFFYFCVLFSFFSFAILVLYAFGALCEIILKRKEKQNKGGYYGSM